MLRYLLISFLCSTQLFAVDYLLLFNNTQQPLHIRARVGEMMDITTISDQIIQPFQFGKSIEVLYPFRFKIWSGDVENIDSAPSLPLRYAPYYKSKPTKTAEGIIFGKGILFPRPIQVKHSINVIPLAVSMYKDNYYELSTLEKIAITADLGKFTEYGLN